MKLLGKRDRRVGSPRLMKGKNDDGWVAAVVVRTGVSHGVPQLLRQ
jgi:hypothetical protein